MTRYFAFGSNMSSARLRARVPSARPLGAGMLEGWRFACNKRGRDGSGKANIVAREGERVWGVVFEVAAPALADLDRFEGGYRRIEVEVTTAGEPVHCHTYVSGELGEALRLRRWYKRHIVDGAEEHRLPRDWRAMLHALPV